jgi:hypothetical protein
MSCDTGTGNIRIEPVNVSWEIEEQSSIVCVADVAESLENKWFGLQASNGTKYYAWYTVTGGAAAVDPAIAGRTALPITIAPNASASAVATATAAAIDAIGGGLLFESNAVADKVYVSNIGAADVEKIFDGTAPTGFTFNQCQQGGYLDCGLLDGNVESSFESQFLEIKSHQTGTSLRAELRQGTTAEISLTMQETDVARIKEVFATVNGGTHTPSGGTELFGWGTNLQGTNTIIQARRLVLHPVTMGADRSRDLCFWKAMAMPETMVFSGEEVNTIAVTFKTYIDSEKPEEIQHWSYGDWTQLIPGA